MGAWRNGIPFEFGDGPDVLFDERTIFERMCRQKGTRINWIMTMIERGMNDVEIAARVRKATGMECDEGCISVYRKALEGKLCDLETGRENQSETGSAVKRNYMRVGTLYFEHGMSRDGISKALHLKRKTVDSSIDKFRKQFKAKRVLGGKRYE